MKAMVHAHKMHMREVLQQILSAARSFNNTAVFCKFMSPLRNISKLMEDTEKLASGFNGESVTVHLTTYLNKCTMLLFPF
jgi:hypothetical protein